MPLISERAGEGHRLFVFLDGLEFIEGTEAHETVLKPLLPFGSYNFYKNLLEESHLLLQRVGGAHAVFLDWSNLLSTLG